MLRFLVFFFVFFLKKSVYLFGIATFILLFLQLLLIFVKIKIVKIMSILFKAHLEHGKKSKQEVKLQRNICHNFSGTCIARKQILLSLPNVPSKYFHRWRILISRVVGRLLIQLERIVV